MNHLRPYRSLLHRIRPRIYQPRAEDARLLRKIRLRAKELLAANDQSLRQLIDTQRSRVRAGVDWRAADVVSEVFAAVNEAVRRKLCLSYYDVQLLAGIALATGSICEMKTGEGKTLVTALPAVVASLSGRGVHVATVNAYLAERDFDTLWPVYDLLGLSTGLLRDGDLSEAKRRAYAADITYGTGYEFGFDYLRDQIALQSQQQAPLGQRFRQQLANPLPTPDEPANANRQATVTVQRGLHFAIIDEVDSVLIDEANTPLVISGPSQPGPIDPEPHLSARQLAHTLVEHQDFTLDREAKQIRLADETSDKLYQQLPEQLARPWAIYVEQALRAKWYLERDVDYVVLDGQVRIVDQYTGRIFSQRTWRDGLHQAVEAKEGVAITAETHSLARISRQRFFQMYSTLCGMSGTVAGHERELNDFYGLSVVQIPLRKPCRRTHLPPRFFADDAAKFRAVRKHIAELHLQRIPVLVGTRTITASQKLSSYLQAAEIPHHVLNGIQDEQEATIVAAAGRSGAVTIATNMAGRGTDIQLDEVAIASAGLHVISLEFHDSMRIDRQLIGRAARQGDPGVAQFFASAEDDLFQQHSPELASRIKRAASKTGEAELDFAAEVRQLQTRVEQLRFRERQKSYQQQCWLDKLLVTIAEPSINHTAGDAA